jgi:hypothetical protein
LLNHIFTFPIFARNTNERQWFQGVLHFQLSTLAARFDTSLTPILSATVGKLNGFENQWQPAMRFCALASICAFGGAVPEYAGKVAFERKPVALRVQMAERGKAPASAAIKACPALRSEAESAACDLAA